jgi:predicted O-methyltransferase YrrM
MRLDERLYLYSFVRGFRPERALEIGVLRGGSGCIIANAMEDNGCGMVVGLDPEPRIEVRKRDFHGRYHLILKPSPEGLQEAFQVAGGRFDFVFIDGLHMYKQVVRDIEGILPFLCDGAYILFHDAFHYGVANAISESVARIPMLHDCGFPCRTPRMDYDVLTPYNGVRLLRYADKRISDAHQVVTPFYEAAGKRAPLPSSDVFDHDQWYCRTHNPCPNCKARGIVPSKGPVEETASADHRALSPS